jgi:hypothetical protein
MIRLRIYLGLLGVCGIWACVEQEPDRPTDEDLRIIKQNILTQAPNMKFKVNADLEGKITYLGLDVDKNVIQPGEQFTLVHYWKVNKPVEDWEIFIHINGENKANFINVDHRAIGGRYPASRWKQGEIIRDEHKITLPATWKDSKMKVYAGLWKGQLRMKIKGPQDEENRVFAVSLPVAIKQVEPPKPKRLVAIKTAKPIKVDGKLDEEIWSKAASTGAFVETMTGVPSPIKSEAKVAWDEKFLYIAFKNEDEDVWSALKARDEKLWTQEAVEVFIDANADGKDYIELQVNPNNAIFDSYLPEYRKNQDDWNSKMQTAVNVEGTLNKREDKDKGWTVEMAIPWADVKGKGTYELSLPPKIGDTWRINFFRLDLPQKKPQLAAGWSPPLVGDFHKLDRFGELVFGDEAGVAPIKTAAQPPAAPATGEPAAGVQPPPANRLKHSLRTPIGPMRQLFLKARLPAKTAPAPAPAKTAPAPAKTAPAPTK